MPGSKELDAVFERFWDAWRPHASPGSAQRFRASYAVESRERLLKAAWHEETERRQIVSEIRARRDEISKQESDGVLTANEARKLRLDLNPLLDAADDAASLASTKMEIANSERKTFFVCVFVDC